jgi:hypothetical protein
MKIFLLKREDACGVDVANGFVVIAWTNLQARELAANGLPGWGPGDEGPAVWMDGNRSRCTELGQVTDGIDMPRVILRDFNAG